MNDKKSDLVGKGYGDGHSWERGETEQSPYPERRSTAWTCTNCNQFFRHFYHCESDIHIAMRHSGVRDECMVTNE